MRKIIGFIPFSGFCVITFLLFTPDSPNESYSKLTFSPGLLLFFLCMLISLSSAILLCTRFIKTGLIVGAAVPVCCLVSLLPDLINPISETNTSVASVFLAYLIFYICYTVCYFTYHHEINKK